MKISKEELKQIIVEEVKKAMVDPALKEMRLFRGDGTAGSCVEIGAEAGKKYAEDNSEIAKSIIRIAVQQRGGKKQISPEAQLKLENAYAAALEGMPSCQEGSMGEGGYQAFEKAFLDTANEMHPLGYSSATGATSRAQLPSKGPRGSHRNPHIGEPRGMAAESLTKEIMKALQEAAK
jgi:hypothetical protein